MISLILRFFIIFFIYGGKIEMVRGSFIRGVYFCVKECDNKIKID